MPKAIGPNYFSKEPDCFAREQLIKEERTIGKYILSRLQLEGGYIPMQADFASVVIPSADLLYAAHEPR